MKVALGFESTADDVLAGFDLSGKRILLTGVSAGLGIETARSLANRGAYVIGTARDLSKASAALEAIGSEPSLKGKIEVVECDLGSLASVERCAQSVREFHSSLDVVIANAGVMVCPFGRTEDGFEMQFGTNHLGHFALVNQLLSSLSRGSRVVVVASSAHRFADIDLVDPNYLDTPYDPILAYGRSKTANILFAVALDAMFKARGIRAVAVHPGSIPTELARHLTPEIAKRMTASASDATPSRYKTIPQGAAAAVWAGIVANMDEVGGAYCEDCGLAEILDDPAARNGVQSYALEPRRAAALWALSEELTRTGARAYTE